MAVDHFNVRCQPFQRLIKCSWHIPNDADLLVLCQFLIEIMAETDCVLVLNLAVRMDTYNVLHERLEHLRQMI